MRKSFAPSFQSSKARPVGKPLETVFNSSPSTDGATSKTVRSAVSILNLLQGSTDSQSCNDTQCQQPLTVNCAANSICNTSSVSHNKRSLENFEDGENFQPLPLSEKVGTYKRKFNVVWGKLSKKKHKKWEGDGVAEIGLNSVILKDCDGKVLGSTRGVKTDELEEGSRLIVGGKEIELIDLILHEEKEDGIIKIDEGNFPYPQVPAAVVKPAKRPKLMLSKTFRSPNNHCQDSLVMPTPPSEHQQTSLADPSDDDDTVIDEVLSI